MVLPFASIVVANYNGKDVIDYCLRSLQALNYPNYEVIVVDDCSIDNSVEVIERDFPHVRLVKLPKNVGLAGANNEGYKYARGNIIVFDLNNDEIVDRDWLTELARVLVNSPDIGITCGKRYQADKMFVRGETILSAGSKMSPITAECAAIGYGKRDGPEYDTQKETDFATVLAIRRELLEQVGLFDPVYGNYYEDADLSIRVRQSGYKLIYVPTAKSWHIGASSFGSHSYRRYYLLRRNQMRFIIKNFPAQTAFLGLMHCLFVKTIIDTLFAAPFLERIMKLLPRSSSKPLIYIPRNSGPDILKAQEKAIVWNLKNLGSSFKARKKIPKRMGSTLKTHLR